MVFACTIISKGAYFLQNWDGKMGSSRQLACRVVCCKKKQTSHGCMKKKEKLVDTLQDPVRTFFRGCEDVWTGGFNWFV